MSQCDLEWTGLCSFSNAQCTGGSSWEGSRREYNKYRSLCVMYMRRQYDRGGGDRQAGEPQGRQGVHGQLQARLQALRCGESHSTHAVCMYMPSSTCARRAKFDSMGRGWRQVLGGGWAGFQVARDLDKDKYDVTVVR